MKTKLLGNIASGLAMLTTSTGAVYATDAVTQHAQAVTSKPNIVFILIDDMPWYGTKVRSDPSHPASASSFLDMPNLEKFAAQSMGFSSAYSAAGMSAPSRCSIQTGMYPGHHNYDGNVGQQFPLATAVTYVSEETKPLQSQLLTPNIEGNIVNTSMGDVMKLNGYATALFGKWHIYGDGPAAHGYDESDGNTDNKDATLAPSSATNPKQVFSITNSGISFMKRQTAVNKPFFLELAHYVIHHNPISTVANYNKYFAMPMFKVPGHLQSEIKSDATTAAVTCDLDDALGMVFRQIDSLGIADNTYVVIGSDNGYRNFNNFTNGVDSLRGGKWWLWDSGIRVPLMVRGPGITPNSHCDVNVSGVDFMSTFADLTGGNAFLPSTNDGQSFKPLLMGQPVTDAYINRPLIYHYPHYRESAPSSAIIIGKKKFMHYYELPNNLYLYDRSTDLGEMTNIAASNKDLALSMKSQLFAKLDAWGAHYPIPNPIGTPNMFVYDPNKMTGNELPSGLSIVTPTRISSTVGVNSAYAWSSPNTLHIDGISEKTFIEIYNAEGKLIIATHSEGPYFANLNKGIYFIHIYNENDADNTFKCIVQ